MNLWRWLVALVVVTGLVILAGTNLSVSAGDAKKDKDGQAGKDGDKDKTPAGKDADKDKTKDKAAKDKEVKEPEAKGTGDKDKAADKDKGDKDKGDKDKGDKDKGAKDKDKGTPEPAPTGDIVWKAFDPPAKAGDPAGFFQKLTTKTEQTMTVQGQEVKQSQVQTFYIQWTPEPKKDGDWVVTQTIIGVNMKIDIAGNVISYNSLPDEKQPANPMTDFFKALMELKLTLTIGRDLEVKSIQGRDEFIKKLAATNPQMETLLTKILSDDALKQMAAPTWGAFPPNGDIKKSPWKKTMKLDLGPIGTYVTNFDYDYKGKEGDADKIDIKANLKYTAPGGSAGGLPFTIKDAQLDGSGSGAAFFDRAKGRFTKSNLNMDLKGNLKIDVGGMETKVDLKQTQSADVVTYDITAPPQELEATLKRLKKQ